MALAQHYGICTELLDFTVDKFVAAFFACTKYNNDGTYSVNDEDGDGCFYYFVDCSLMCEIEFCKNDFLGRHLCILGVKKIHKLARVSV